MNGTTNWIDCVDARDKEISVLSMLHSIVDKDLTDSSIQNNQIKTAK